VLRGGAALLAAATSPPLCDLSPPCFEAFGELAIFAARSLDMPLSLSASYCFSFLTLADFEGIWPPFAHVATVTVVFPNLGREQTVSLVVDLGAVDLEPSTSTLRDIRSRCLATPQRALGRTRTCAHGSGVTGRVAKKSQVVGRFR
jgi:hypothetical protein